MHSPVLTLTTLTLMLSTTVLPAIDGSNPVFATTPDGQTTGWKTFEILSGNDPLGALAVEDFAWSNIHSEWDGLGAYQVDDATLRVFLNQEVEPEGSVTRIDLHLANLMAWIEAGSANNTAANQVLPAAPVIKAVSQAWTQIGDDSATVNSACSGNVWPANTFGPDRGFSDSVHLFAQEVTGGHFRLIDLATRTLYQATDLGTGRWENAVPIDTGRSDTIALVLSEDFKSGTNRLAPMRLYLGTKSPDGGFLERNGLVGGTIYYWDPDDTSSTNATTSGLFADGNGTAVTGTWVTSKSDAGLFSNTEDLHPNMQAGSPGFGRETVQSCEGEGIFHVDFSQLTFVTGALGDERSSKITLLFQSGTQESAGVFSEMDNLVWASDGHVYACEDGPTGDIWRVDPASLLASYAGGDFTPDASQVSQILAANPNAESSGIIEISASLHYQPGSIFLVNGKSTSLAGNQLALLVSPSAALQTHTLQYTPGPGGTLTGTPVQTVPYGHDGSPVTAIPAQGFAFLGWSDGEQSPSRTELSVTSYFEASALFTNAAYLTWIADFPAISGLDRAPLLDVDLDDFSNLLEYALNLDPSIPITGISGLPTLQKNPVSGSLEYSFLHRIDNPNLIVTPQVSDSLEESSWVDIAINESLPINSAFERAIIFPTPGTKFFRLKVNLIAE